MDIRICAVVFQYVRDICICVCRYVCVYVCVCIISMCVYTYVWVCYVSMYLCTYACAVSLCVYVWVSVLCQYVCMCEWVCCVGMYVCAYKCAMSVCCIVAVLCVSERCPRREISCDSVPLQVFSPERERRSTVLCGGGLRHHRECAAPLDPSSVSRGEFPVRVAVVVF